MGLTIKQEKFCQVYIELGNASYAYREAYNTENMKEASINVNASKLLADAKVMLRIEELRAEIAKKHEITKDTLLAELEEARQLALKTEKAAAMVSATMGKAKLVGLDIVKVEHTGENGTPLQPPTFIINGVKPNGQK